MIIKTTRLQAWAPAEGARVARRPPPPPENKKQSFLAILGAFLLRFSHFGEPFHYVGAFLLLFTSWWGHIFGLAPPPRKYWFESMLPKNFLCDRNLVSSGHVLLQFCLKNNKNDDKL